MSGRKLPVIFLSALSLLVANCGSDGDIGNTSINVIVPDGGADGAGIDIQSVDYTIQCDGNSATFLDGNDSFDDTIRIDGSLDVVDGRTSGSPPVPTEIWTTFASLPPGPCIIQLRAYDNDGDRICVANDGFTVTADGVTKVNLLLVCSISFQSPVGMADIDATFSFVVGNFCPDLFTLNSIDGDPATPGVEVQVRGYDPDSTCSQNCDPQTCDNTVIPPVCTPGPDPGVSISVSTDIGTLDCDQDGTPEGASCVLLGDQFNTGDIDYACTVSGPATITAVITDGDVDCDETKSLQVVCP